VIIFDGFFLGKIGTDALAGASLAFPWIMLVLQTTNSGMGAGVSSAVARALGAGQREKADELAFHAFLLALALAAIFSAVMLLAAPYIFGWMGGRDKMLMDALDHGGGFRVAGQAGRFAEDHSIGSAFPGQRDTRFDQGRVQRTVVVALLTWRIGTHRAHSTTISCAT